MTEEKAKRIEEALVRWGDTTGEYLKIVDTLAYGYKGPSQGEKVSNLIDDYLQYKGYETFEEALKGVGNDRY